MSMSFVSALLVAVAFGASLMVYRRRGTIELHSLEFRRKDHPAEFWGFAILLSTAVAGVVFLSPRS